MADAPTKLNFATLEYVIEGKVYKINPEGHLPKVADVIIKEAAEYEKVFTKVNKVGAIGGEAERLKKQRKSTKVILELGFVDFVYEDAAEIHGYGMLDQVATEMYRFLVVSGGKAGIQHSLQQLGLNTENTSNGSPPEQEKEEPL